MFLILIVSFPSLIFAHIGYSTQSYCLNDIQSGILLLGCPKNQLIKLGRIIYGYSWSNDCSYIDKDCTMDLPREDITCLTTTNCTVRVVEHPLILQDCWNLAATYVQAEYECIRDYSIENICQSQDIYLTHGFLSTPNYPNGFLSNLNCPCTLIPSLGHSIILEIIHFHLPVCTEAGFILWLGQDFQTKCLTQEPVTLISNIQQNITIRFYSLKTNQHGGFLMKYSISPQSNNATVHLQCYPALTINRSTISNNFLNTKTSTQVQKIVEQEEDDDNEDVIELSVTNSNSLSKQFRSIASINEAHKDILKQQLQSLNQSIYRKNIPSNSSELPRTNMTLLIIFIITVVVFLIIINILIWFMCSLRSKSSKSTSSIQNLYSHQPKVTMYQPSQRLKTLHSLLYADHQPNDIEPITTNSIRHLDSVLSECPISSNSSSTNLQHGFIIKSKSNQKLHQPRQINSWDDI